MTPGGSQAWKSHARFSHPPPSDDRGVYDFLPGLLAKTTRWHNGRTRRSQNPNSEEVFQDCLTKWEESAAHSILARSDQLQQRPNTFAQTNLSISLFACDKAAEWPVTRHPGGSRIGELITSHANLISLSSASNRGPDRRLSSLGSPIATKLNQGHRSLAALSNQSRATSCMPKATKISPTEYLSTC